MATEREVILEERRSRTENNPSSILSEQMSAALYQNHPYRIPIIGWMHEMKKLSREDALTFYKRFYAPNNAIVVVTGDVTAEEVKTLAEAAYGALKPNPAIKARERAAGAAASRRRAASSSRTRAPATPRCGASTWRRAIAKADKGEAEALYLLMKIAGNGSTSRLYQKLVVGGEDRLQRRRLVLGQRPRQRLDRRLRRRPRRASASTRSRRAIDRVLHELREKPVTADELERAKKAFIAEFIYEFDSQASLARRYGEGCCSA